MAGIHERQGVNGLRKEMVTGTERMGESEKEFVIEEEDSAGVGRGSRWLGGGYLRNRSGCRSVCESVGLSVCLSVWLSVCLSVCPPVCTPLSLSTCLSVCLSVSPVP